MPCFTHEMWTCFMSQKLIPRMRKFSTIYWSTIILEWGNSPTNWELKHVSVSSFCWVAQNVNKTNIKVRTPQYFGIWIPPAQTSQVWVATIPPSTATTFVRNPSTQHFSRSVPVWHDTLPQVKRWWMAS